MAEAIAQLKSVVRRRPAVGIILAVLAVVVAAVAYQQSRQSPSNQLSDVPEGVLVGQRALNFTLQTADGRTVSLADYRGRPVLVNFWGTWCTVCREEFPVFEQVYRRYRDQGFEILTVNIGESAAAVRQYAQDMGLSMPMLLDSDRAITQAYRVFGTPTNIIIDKNGIITDRMTRGLEEQALVRQVENLLKQAS
ncbi:MAG: TlpA family protein disulfide reductase [Deinococcus sp.]|nr:TlpA family protein disulfide reductase [Deinococcus sp.]